MPQTPEQLAHYLRAGALPTVLGIAIALAGLLAFASYLIAHKRRDSALLWFGSLATLYGVRLLIQCDPVRLALGFNLSARDYWNAAISYVLPVFGTLFFDATFPLWRRLFRRLLAAQVVFAIAGPVSDAVAQVPFSLRAVNNWLVIAWILVLLFVLLRAKRTPESGILGVAFAVFAVTVLIANLSLFLGRDLDFEVFGFVVWIVCLAAVVIRRAVQSQERLTAIEEELSIARRIQTSILPPALPRTASIDIAARYVSMTAVAGDFYDFLILDETRLGVLVADVTGHGVPAALIASMIKIAAAAQQAWAGDPARVLGGMNQTLSPNLQGQFVTAAYLFLDLPARRFRYAAAAHPRMQWLKRAANAVEAVEENGLPMGVTPSSAYLAREHSYTPHDRFLLFTDGLLEASDGRDEFFGEERLQKLVLDSAHLGAGPAADYILRHLSHWAGYGRGRTQEDDLTLLVIDLP